MFDQIIPETQTIFETVGIGFGLVTIISGLGRVVLDVIYSAIRGMDR